MAQLVRHFAHNWLVPGSNFRQVEIFFQSFLFSLLFKGLLHFKHRRGKWKMPKKKKRINLPRIWTRGLWIISKTIYWLSYAGIHTETRRNYLFKLWWILPLCASASLRKSFRFPWTPDIITISLTPKILLWLELIDFTPKIHCALKP